MRLMFLLKANKSMKQKDFMTKYHNAFQSLIYKKLGETKKFSNLHDEKRISNFSFSSLHVVKDSLIREGCFYKIIVSSPNPEFISSLFFAFSEREMINLGEGSFNLIDLRILPLKISSGDIIENVTLISLTKSVNNKIKPIKFGEEYIVALTKNLLHKYNEYHKEKIDDFDLFKNVKIELYKNRMLSQPLIFTKNERVKVFNVLGYLLRFKLENLNAEQLKVFEYCFDAGFGERTSYGFGFMIKRWNK